MKKRLVIFGERKTDFDLDLIINKLRSRLDYMHDLSIEDLLAFFNELMAYWNKSGLSKKYPYLKNLSDFFIKINLSTKLKIALHNNYLALDEFVELGDKQMLFHAQPRGLTVHWLAGNVTVLALFSIFQALITKNVCLAKASSKNYQEIVFLLETLKKIKTNKIDGKELAKSISVILIENDDKEIHEKMSEAADVRIAWGGFESINTVVGLKKNLFCEDIIFGPKYSFSVIDKQSLKNNFKKLAQRLAVDVSIFDQYACSSPHTVFVQGNALTFAKELAKQLEFVNRTMLPKGKIDPSKASEIIKLRTEYELKAKVISSSGTEWTVVVTDEQGLAKGCFSRVIFVKSIDNLEKLKDYNDRQKQTLGVGLSQKNKLKYIDKITTRGIDRCPNLGYSSFYESPWDGMFVFDRLVRWVTFYKDN